MDNKPKHKNKVEDELKTWSWLRTGMIALLGLGYGLLMQLVFGNLQLDDGMNNMALVAFLGGVPLVIGALSTRLIPPIRRTWFNVTAVAIAMAVTFLFFVTIAQSGLFFCVLIASPLIIGVAVVGALIFKRLDRYFLERKTNQYAFAGFVMLLPLALAPLEAHVQSPIWYRNVQDEIVIKASAEEVWNDIIRMDTIAPSEQRPSIYQSLGIPRPIEATLDYEGVGGVRIGQFEYGLTFVEEITVWDVYERVRFDVDVQHNDQSTAVLKHIGGRYFDVIEAGYAIEPLDAEHVILRLDSDYRLSTNFNGYGAFWSDWIMHDFQMYVLTTVKQRAEAS